MPWLLDFHPEMVRVASTHISLADVSHVASLCAADQEVQSYDVPRGKKARTISEQNQHVLPPKNALFFSLKN